MAKAKPVNTADTQLTPQNKRQPNVPNKVSKHTVECRMWQTLT